MPLSRHAWHSDILCRGDSAWTHAIGTTVYPTGLCCASTWNPSLLYRMGDAMGKEVRSQGGNVGYGPVLDVAREPRWSRMEEGFGEDLG